MRTYEYWVESIESEIRYLTIFIMKRLFFFLMRRGLSLALLHDAVARYEVSELNQKFFQSVASLRK